MVTASLLPPRIAFSNPLHGIRTVKQLPLPISLSTATLPPCSSTNFSTRVRPSPVPAYRRESLESNCVNGLKRRFKSSVAIPIPVSRTENIRDSLSKSHLVSRVTLPPSGVNFTALESRFTKICFRRRSSTTSMTDLLSMASVIFKFFFCACSRINRRLAWHTSSTLALFNSNSILPAPILARSSKSLIKDKR